MPSTQLLLVIGIGAIAFGVRIYFLVRKLFKVRGVKKMALENPSLNVDFMDMVIDKLEESLDLSHVLDVVVEKFESKVLYLGASYILKETEELVVFKSIVKPEVSRAHVEEVKTRLFKEFEALTHTDPFKFRVEEYVVGGPLNEEKEGEIGSYLSVPLYKKDVLIGAFSLFTKQKNAYSEAAKTYLNMALGEVMAISERLIGMADKEKEKLQGIVDNMTEGVLVVDKNFRVLVENPRVSSLVGIRNLSGVNFFDLNEYFSSQLDLEDEVSEAFTSGMPKKISDIEKGEKFFELMLLPIMNKEAVVRVGIIIYDQTEEMELEKLRREFSAMVIHELRSPLTVIKGTVEVVMGHEKEFSPDDTHKFLEQIKDSAANLLEKVNDLLDAAKIEDKRIELFRDFFDINEILSETSCYYSNVSSQKDISVTTDLDDSLINIYIDKKKITQVLNNLVSNALKFTPENGNVVLKSVNKGETIEISVSDTGGVPGELKTKLFDKYVRGKDSKERGTGLGLVIAKGIVEAHGGKIWIEDNEPNGARFVFSLSKQTS